jgi:UDP-glucose 4-epimerase
MNKWVVTGSAGYIGAHISRTLLNRGITVVGVDNLSSGIIGNLHPEMEFHNLDIRDSESLKEIFENATGVIHTAGYKFAALSVSEPREAFSNNLEGTESVLTAMKEVRCENIIFSSSCAVYGTPTYFPVKESSPLSPGTPYAESKLLAEEAIKKSGANYISLRFFNVVGSGIDNIEDQSKYNLFPIILDAWQNHKIAHITGNNFPTSDGTAIRDYIHVDDIVSAHLRSIEYLNSTPNVGKIYNLSLGQGVSVLQIMKNFKEALGGSFDYDYVKMREGDPSCIYGSATLAESELNWKAEKSLKDMVESAISARKSTLKIKSVQPYQQSARSALGMQQSRFE